MANQEEGQQKEVKTADGKDVRPPFIQVMIQYKPISGEIMVAFPVGYKAITQEALDKAKVVVEQAEPPEGIKPGIVGPDGSPAMPVKLTVI